MNDTNNNSTGPRPKVLEITALSKSPKTGVSSSVAGALAEIKSKNSSLISLLALLEARITDDKALAASIGQVKLGGKLTEAEAEAYNVLGHIIASNRSWATIIEQKLARLNRA